ncbi:MAG TPA: hypothetical protein VH540_08275 [Ktedonobacterales bacterium]|jgi:hypothetical protein
MQFIYRLFVFLLGVIGAAAALGINVFYSSSTRFQNLVGTHPDASHGWLGLGLIVVAFLGALLSLFKGATHAGGILLIIAGIAFFFIVNWWALLASPQLILAGFFALFYYFYFQRVRSQARGAPPAARRPEYPPQEGGTPAVG